MTPPVELALHLVGDGAEWDVLAEVDERARVADLAAALEAVVGHRPQLYRFGELLDADHGLGDVGVRAGDTLGVDLALGLDLRRFGPELHVVAGQGAGQRVRLTNRAITIGRAEECDVVLSDGRASRAHAEVVWTGEAFSVTDLGSRNGTIVDGTRLAQGETRSCQPGDPVLLGDTVVTVRAETPEVSATRPTGPFHVALTAGRSHTASVAEAPIEFPSSPSAPGARRPMLMLTAPLAGVAAVAAAGAPPSAVAAFAAVPLLVGGALVLERVRSRRRGEVEARHHALAVLAARDEIVRRRRLFERDQRALWPDPAAVGAAVAHRSALVWSHGDPTWRVRLGLVDRAGAITVVEPPGRESLAPERAARLVPHTVALAATTLALVGPERDLDGVTAWIVLQLVALRPPGQVEVLVVTTEPSRWAWLALTPHVTSVIDARVDRPSRADSRSAAAGQRLVVFDRVPASQADLAAADDSVLWRCLETGWLPPSTTTTVTAGTPGRILVRSALAIDDLVPDAIDEAVALDIGRGLSGLRVPSLHRTRALPERVHLVDLLPWAIEPNALVERWGDDDGALEALVGADSRGPVHVRFEGQNSHALVAGSTGSGKTRLVETLVVSLAAHHAPNRFSFFVVDFKGGNELARLAELPHCVGFVSDRDRAEVDRAVRALVREIARRDEVLAAAGAADLVDFERLTGAPMPRLLVVADEFGQFRRDDTTGSGVAALLRVAAQGRSKGVHLMLATQSPSTDVTADIRQNVGIRLCLRVAEAAESAAVIGTADAARLPGSAGRVLLMRDGELLEVQVALARGLRAASAPLVAVRTLLDTASPPPPATGCDDDLTRIISAMRTASEAVGAEARPLLAPALNDRHERAQAPGALRPWTLGGLVLGLADRPGSGEPSALAFDPLTHATLVVVGGPRSGRSTLLLTAAAATRAQADPDHPLVVHAVDWAGGGLVALRDAPGDAGVVERGDIEHLRRLVAWLRSPGVPGVARLVLIDRLDALLHDCRDLDSGAFPADLISLLNDGPQRGVHAVVTLDAPAVASGPASRLGGPRLVLPLADSAQAVAAGLPRRSPGPPGRATLLPEGLEAHVGWPEPPGTSSPAPVAGRVEALPDVVRLDDLDRVSAEQVIVGGGGVSGGETVMFDLDLVGPAVVVIGRAGSGRSTALATMAASYQGRRKVVDLRTALRSASWEELVAGPPALLVADDEPLVRADAPALGAGDLAEQLNARGHVLVASFSQSDLAALAFGHWLMRRPRPGLLLALDASADRLLACERAGFAPPPELRAGPPGRGWWCHGGVGISVQVARG